MKLIFRLTDDDFGEGAVKFEWRPGGSHIAACGANRQVKILDRNGRIFDEIVLSGAMTSMAWDKDGDILALTNDKTSAITLWEFGTKKTEILETGMGTKEWPTIAFWSKISPILAVGSNKGNLLIYNHRSARKVPVLGKHQRGITCGAFSASDLLALGADDATVTVSSVDGDSVYSFTCSSDPSNIQFHNLSQPDKSAKPDTTLSTVLGRKILMLVNLNDSENPINLQFQARYGEIVSYVWFLDGYLLMGFENGFMVCISAHASEIGQEIFSVQDFKTYLSSVFVSETFEKALMVGDNQLKIREMNQLGEMFGMYEVEGEDKGLSRVAANSDGQLVAVSGVSGTLHVYITKMPMLGASYRDTIALLSSLTEVTVYRESEKNPLATFPVKVEPSVIGLGPLHIAVALNNRAWFYELTSNGAELVCEFEYMSTVLALLINYEYAVAKLDGKAQLHKLRNRLGKYDNEESGVIFPDGDHEGVRLTDVGLTEDFFINCTDAGHLQYFSLDDWSYVSEFKHVAGIRTIFPDPDGIRLCFFDDRLDACVYSPVDDSLIKVSSIESTAHLTACLWEIFTVDRDTFVICDANVLYVFLLSKNKIQGEQLMQIGTTAIPYGHKPMVLCKGIVHCRTQSGRPGTILLDSHKTETVFDGKSSAALQKLLDQALTLKRWLNAWKICDYTKNATQWRKFAYAAMQNADVDLAIRIFKQIEDVGMVWALEEVQGFEERKLLAGHVALIMEQFDVAEKYFLESSRPTEALQMRRDLLHWEKALQLARRLAPQDIPYISKEYAQQLEFMGEYSTALSHYENGVIEHTDDEELSDELLDHNEICRSGIARMSIRVGDIRRGIAIASELNGRAVKKDCALILEQMKQFSEASQLYERALFYDRAAAVCLKYKNWAKVGELLPKVRSPKIHSQYGKVMEGEKKYKEAAQAYKNARDYDNLVRILLDHLQMPEEAVRIVKESRSVEGAKLVARFFGKLGDSVSAIQFLVLSQCHQEAFQLAETEQKMEVYAEAIDDEGTVEEFSQLADYFAANRNNQAAGKYHYKAKRYRTALEYLLTNGENAEAMKTAIACVAEARDPELSKQLTDFLMGETDGIPKDAKFLFRYYVAMQMISEAARTAVIIARDEQARGSYRVAHQLLFGMHNELVQRGVKVPLEMQNDLMLLHSYLIVKGLVKRGEHLRAARMLIRVANNISRFPAHVVPLLTSAVIECSKAGLKHSAFVYAAQLLKPENRKSIDEKYKKRIEAIVRKTDKSSDVEESKSECPYCDQLTEETQLVCNGCKNLIPYCIITGRHIVTNDFAQCPSCNFPGFFSEFKKLSEASEKCPMCAEDIREVLPSDGKAFLSHEKNGLKAP